MSYVEGNYDRAAELLTELVEVQRSNPIVPFYRGISLWLSGQLEPAVEQLERAARLRGSLGGNRYRYYLGNALAQVDREEEARQALSAVAESAGSYSEEAKASLDSLSAE